MAVITTTQDGVLTGVGLTDTVIVNHNAVIVADTTFGTSPSDQTTLALTINTGGKVTINPNVTVVVRGNLTASGGSAVAIADVFDLKEGAKLLLDSSLAATPATMYKFKLSPYAKVKSTGVSTNKVVIGGSISGGGVVSDFTSYETGGLWDCVHTVFQKWGSSAVQGWKTFPKADGVVGTSVTDCEFDGCGAVRCGPYNIGGKCTFLRTKWSNTLGASSHRFDGKVGDSSQIMKDCVFDQSSGALFYPASGWDVTGTYFGKTVSSKASIVDGVDQRFLNFAGNFINNMTSNYVFEGDIKDSVILLDGGNNINMYHHYATIADAVMEGVIFDPVSVSVTSDIIFPHSRAIDYKCIYKKNIFRPLPDGTAPGKFVSIMPNSDEVGKQNVFVENNTIATHKNVIEVETGIGIGEVLSIDYTSPGDLKSYRNNIGWTALGGTPGYHITHQDSSNQNIVDPANVDYNCGFNLNTDAIYGKGFTKWPTNPTNVWPSGGLGVHDISIDPKFVDSSRCVALYDTVKLGNSVAPAWASGVSYSIGDVISSTTVGLFNGLAVNFRCIKDHTSLSGNSINGVPVVASSWRTNWELMGVYRIRENVSRISDCREWIKAGFAPTEQALKGAGYLGVDIGAVPVGGGSSNNADSSDGFLFGINGSLLKSLISSYVSPIQKTLN